MILYRDIVIIFIDQICVIHCNLQSFSYGCDNPPPPLVSYPDPNVRNDDYRLQYNITYRGSGNEVVGNGS